MVKTSKSRKNELDVIGSPLFSVTNTTAFKATASIDTLANAGTWEFHVTDELSRAAQYMPQGRGFDSVEISNQGTSAIKFYWNQHRDLGFWVASGSMRSIEREGFREFKIENQGTAVINPDQIEVTFYRKGLDADKAAQLNAKKKNQLSLMDALKAGFMLVK